MRLYLILFQDFAVMLSVLLIGDSGVGKTSIMNRFSDDAFTNSHITTIGIDFKIRTIAVNGKQVKLQVWDTAGQERFHCITHSYYRKADGIVLVYDITDRNSFDNISRWLRNIEEYAPTGIVKILLGNKCDMPNRRVVSRDLAEKIAADHNIKFLETSAKANINIDNAFYDMAKAILEKQPDEPRTNRSVVNPHNGRENSAGGCCF